MPLGVDTHTHTHIHIPTLQFQETRHGLKFFTAKMQGLHTSDVLHQEGRQKVAIDHLGGDGYESTAILVFSD